MEVVGYVRRCYEMLAEYLDGKNAAHILTEFGIRFFYLVYNHIMEYQYNTMGLHSQCPQPCLLSC